MRLAGNLLALLLLAGGGAGVALADAQAQPQAADAAPRGEPEQGERLRDVEFGVATRNFGLERTVEMYQWHQAGQGYFAGWSLEPVDSSGFAAGHDNPGAFPIQGREWRDRQASLDGKPLALEAIARLGQWRAFRPDFSALPGNLSATFQPEGDGLGSSENPLDPQIGDLRITWRELVLPPLAGKVLLRAGRWELSPTLAGPGATPLPAEAPVATPLHAGWLAGGTLLLLAAIAVLLVRRRGARG